MKNVLTEYTKLQLILFDLENEYPKISDDGKRNFKELFKMFNIKNSSKVLENKSSNEIDQENLYNNFRKGHLHKLEFKNKWWVSRGVLRLRYDLSVPTILKYRKQGMPGILTGRGWMFNIDETDQWMRDNKKGELIIKDQTNFHLLETW
tara:strand:- start:1940 stop:2386 length:447 start_codon:yes stop_codon:yes gene_type:complete